ncbi:hypothetical protein, partial [Umezakia ovalisporum]|uniref:hypothetical protein n=1 Tax=Umezakia ovalisporum TaxID=75695 RepID=UPI0039C654E6
IETKISSDELSRDNKVELTNKLYNEAKGSYLRKCEALRKEAMPVFKNIRSTQGANIENVFVPFSDGKRGLQALTPLQKT